MILAMMSGKQLSVTEYSVWPLIEQGLSLRSLLKEYYYRTADSVYRALRAYDGRLWATHIMHGILFVLVPLRCIGISGVCIVGTT